MTSLYTSLEHSEKDQGGKAGLYIYPEAAVPDNLVRFDIILSDQE